MKNAFFSSVVLLTFLFTGCNAGEVKTKSYFANNPDEINSLDCNKEKLSNKEKLECDNARIVGSLILLLNNNKANLEHQKKFNDDFKAKSGGVDMAGYAETVADIEKNIKKQSDRLEAIKAGKED